MAWLSLERPQPSPWALVTRIRLYTLHRLLTIRQDVLREVLSPGSILTPTIMVLRGKDYENLKGFQTDSLNEGENTWYPVMLSPITSPWYLEHHHHLWKIFQTCFRFIRFLNLPQHLLSLPKLITLLQTPPPLPIQGLAPFVKRRPLRCTRALEYRNLFHDADYWNLSCDLWRSLSQFYALFWYCLIEAAHGWYDRSVVTPSCGGLRWSCGAVEWLTN